ncbi:MAG: hypothetical protein L0212_02600 [Acidobacteria bacterium]|nr:hypothetical protein [Acidobacteriota bacterium]
MASEFELPLDLDLDKETTVPAFPARRELPLVNVVVTPSESLPHLGVYVLTEFVFCPRAGLCALGAEREEEEEPPPAWGRWPAYYTLREIEGGLVRAFRHVWVLLFLTVAAGVSGVVLEHVAVAYWPLGLGAACLWFGLCTAQRGVLIVALELRRRRALGAPPVEPDPASSAPQVVQWWELLRADFEPIPVPASLHDPEWNLSGRPWRLLRKGGRLIPVWRLNNPNREIHLQHRVRMVAYCHLLERSLGSEGCAPYGVILFGDSYEGTTVSFSLANLQTLFAELSRAHQSIRDSERGVDPPEPNSARLCWGCPHGRPEPYRPGRSNHRHLGRSLPVVRAVDARERVYHSHCGDRSCWLPRHEVTINKNLRLGS